METLKPAILEHSFLRSLPPAYLEILIDCASNREFEPGEIIFREGEIADRFYLIRRGKVALESIIPPRGLLSVQELGSDEVLGWSWLFPPYVWHFQARAVEMTQAISFNGAHLLIACERNHEFGYDLMKRLTQILIRRLQATRKQLARLHDEHVPLCAHGRSDAL
jgi:CRP-like cAMP-binding protein